MTPPPAAAKALPSSPPPEGLDHAAPQTADPPTYVVDPRVLPLARRLDVVVKWLYARQRLGLLPQDPGIDADRLYRQHIHLRTGGVEPGDEARKSSIDDFVRQFDALIAAMARSGFDPTHPVPFSADNALPLNGAHRIAAALAVGCGIALRIEPGPGGGWDFAWFRDHGFSREDRNGLIRALTDLKPAQVCVTVLWSPVEAAWPDLEGAIHQKMPVVDARTLELPRPAFDELVRDIYSFDWGPRVGANIERKIGLLAGHPPRVRVLFSERSFVADADLPRRLKVTLREAHGTLSPVDHFTTLHLSGSPAETRHLVGIFASENNLRRLRRRVALRPALVDMLVEMKDALRARRIDGDDCCVVGSAVLDVLGLRPADDVDFTLRKRCRFAHFDGGVTHLGPRVDVVSVGYARSFGTGAALADDDIIARPDAHFMVRGMRFADPSIVMTRKQHQRRDKDLRDVALLSAFFDGEN